MQTKIRAVNRAGVEVDVKATDGGILHTIQSSVVWTSNFLWTPVKLFMRRESDGTKFESAWKFGRKTISEENNERRTSTSSFPAVIDAKSTPIVLFSVLSIWKVNRRRTKLFLSKSDNGATMQTVWKSEVVGHLFLLIDSFFPVVFKIVSTSSATAFRLPVTTMWQHDISADWPWVMR